ncbi:MAG TPA: DUF2203 family protein [Candidatus Nanoarchaeia archaeon]|nr:DUF2203 family protein [Candidatus Nanoarchaeia archaeon]
MKKYYSISEAEETIPLLKQKIVDLVKLSKGIDLLDSIDIQYEDEYETLKQDVAMNIKFHDYSLQFCKEINKLLEMGVVLKDVEHGLVNFFSMHAGKEIFLCWKLGEENIHAWYALTESYEARKPISELKSKKKA